MSATKKMWIERFSNAFNKLNPNHIVKWCNNLNGGSIFTAFLAINVILVFGLVFDIDPIIYYAPTIGNLGLLIFAAYILIVKSQHLHKSDSFVKFFLGLTLFAIVYTWSVIQWACIPLPQTYLKESVADECYATVMAETTKDTHTHISMLHHIQAKHKCGFGDKNQPSTRAISQQEIIQSAILQHAK